MASFGQADSAKIYQEIHNYSQRHKFTRWIYSGIFVPPKAAPEPPPTAPVTVRVDPFRQYEGKVVRQITVRSFDPFGYSVDDTSMAPVNLVQRWGNILHRTTRPIVIRNLLLAKALKPLIPLQLSESERVLRASPNVNDARIIVEPVPDAPDSVDLLVLVHDEWSLNFSGQASPNSASGSIQEKNFLGLGQSLEQGLGLTQGESRPDLWGSHQVYNMGQSHISSSVTYAKGPSANNLGISMQRPFYSPLARWAAGAAWGQNWSRYLSVDPAGVVLDDRILSPTSLDVWAGRAFRLGNGLEPGSSNSNFVLAARYAQTRYATRPPMQLDPEGLHRTNTLFLVSGGLSIRQYYKERYLYRFGTSEDVPEGLLISLTTGIDRRERTANMPYVGAAASRGRNYEGFGYLSTGLAYGTFFQRRQVVNGVFNMHLLYFSDLRSIGRWHYRQFFRFNAVYGYNQPVYQRLAFTSSELYGLPPGSISGTHRELVRSETVFYAPWTIFGFKVGPVLLAGVGTMGQEAAPLFSGRVYSAIRVGLLVRNENLLVNTFQVSLGFYPYLPSSGAPGLLFNAFDSFAAGALGFDYGEPATVSYQ